MKNIFIVFFTVIFLIFGFFLLYAAGLSYSDLSIYLAYSILAIIYVTLIFIKDKSDSQKGEGQKLLSKKQFDEFETEILLLDSDTAIYDFASDWLLTNLPVQMICFAFYNDSDNPEIKHYKEKSDSKKYLKEMFTQRGILENPQKILFHGQDAFSSVYGVENNHPYVLFVKMQNTYDQVILKNTFVPINRILKNTFITVDNTSRRRENKQLQYAFSRYISPDLVSQIVQDPEQLHVGGTSKFLSVIFTDLKDFTKLSDSLEPIKLVRILNEYLNEMSAVIINLGGTIDKFEGDAILAFFGAPTVMEDHARRCCEAAIRIKKMENILNEKLMAQKLITEPLVTRIGINSGDMIVGNIGSINRLEYTIIGSNVNIASRIENINKQYGTNVLVSQTTWDLVKDYFDARYVDTVALRGVSRKIPLYELLGECEDVLPLN